MSDVNDLLTAINSDGGLKIQMTAVQDWSQFWMLLIVAVIGSIMVFIWLGMLMKPQIAALMIQYRLWKISRCTGRHIVIVKHTSSDLFSMSMINMKTLENIRRAIISFKGKPFDLVLHTPGGAVFAGQLISKLLRSYKGDVRAIIPVYAMSGGSFLALSCDKILMSDCASLGAIDPQLGYLWHSGSAKSWEEVVKKKHGKSNDETIQMAYTGKQYTDTLFKRVYEILENKISDTAKRESTARYLTDGGIEHARPLMIADLTNLGIPVSVVDDNIITLVNPILDSSFYEGEYWR